MVQAGAKVWAVSRLQYVVVQCTGSWVEEKVHQFSAESAMWWCMGVAQGVGRGGGESGAVEYRLQ